MNIRKRYDFYSIKTLILSNLTLQYKICVFNDWSFENDNECRFIKKSFNHYAGT